MELFQILDCNTTLGTCCSDYGLVVVLDTTRKIFELFQFIVPILLIIMGTVQFVHLSINPELKDGFRKILNKFIAAFIIFLLPVLIDAVLGLMSDTYQVSACWEEAKVNAEIVRSTGNSYIDMEDENKFSKMLIDTTRYKKYVLGSAQIGSNTIDQGNGEGSQTGKSIARYAKKFVGESYVYGGTWNGEEPYTATDCSGFVSGVFKHFGYSLYPQTAVMWNDTSKYDLVTTGNIKAGDIVMYDGHVGILTGNGNEIIHAKGSRYGVVKESDYRTCSSKQILGIMRVKGVN
ncbi:MAG: C40 family peptidase [Bacilli bacterium]|nr:C40 family peptidase [Bacilli bacterium]